MFEKLFEKCLAEDRQEGKPFWLDSNGILLPIKSTHYKDGLEILKNAGVVISKELYWEDVLPILGKETGYVRIVLKSDELGVEIITPTITGSQKRAILNLARDYPSIFWSTTKRGEYGTSTQSFIDMLKDRSMINV